MPERRHESADLEDYEVLDSSDTLAGPPGEDPLDRGVATPAHWSKGVRSGTTAAEQQEGESLDDLLAEEQPEVGGESYDDETYAAGASYQAGGDEFADLDENAPEGDVERGLLDDEPDRRAGRLVTEEADTDEISDVPVESGESVARDTGIGDRAATAEEAAVHVQPEEEDEQR